jgi:hypothetical protein
MIFTISRQEKVRRDAGASAPPGCISFKKKSLLFLLCWNASRESRREPSRKRLGLKLVIGKGRERKGKEKEEGEMGEKGKWRSIQIAFGGKSCTNSGITFWMPDGKALPKEPRLSCCVPFVGRGEGRLGCARL